MHRRSAASRADLVGAVGADDWALLQGIYLGSVD
jgi:hypothetical protein